MSLCIQWSTTIFPSFPKPLSFSVREEYVATFKGSEYFCYDLSPNPIQSSSDEITLSFKTLQRNGLMLHTGKSADYVNLALKNGAVSLVINLGSGAFEALVEPVNGKFNDNAWHDVKVTRNLRQVTAHKRRWSRLDKILFSINVWNRKLSLVIPLAVGALIGICSITSH